MNWPIEPPRKHTSRAGERPIVVTGIGAISAAGRGCAALWRHAQEGRDGLRPHGRGLDPAWVGLVPDWSEARSNLGDDEAQALCRTYGELAAREALTAAGLTASPRIALLFGSNLYDRPCGLDTLAAQIARAVGAAGPSIAVSTACASSTSAIALAADLLQDPAVDAVLAGGADVVTPLVVAGFRVLRLLAPERCAPFSLPSGLSPGEGAAFLVLERAQDAVARGVRSKGVLVGAGLAADAFHMTSPDPRGGALSGSIERALRRAGLTHSAIAYINAHGTGTDSGDRAEICGLLRAFGGRLPPISASKSILGHAQGAAGALEAAMTLEGLARGLAPPTLHHVGPRAGCAVDVIAEGRPRPLTGDVVLSVNAGFGGAAAAVIFAAQQNTCETSSPPRRAVWLWGMHGSGPRTRGDERLEPTASALTAAVELAWTAKGRSSEAPGASHGLFCISTGVSPGVTRECEAVIHRRGIERIPPTLFSRALVISPAGACSEALGLRGPLCAFVGAAGSAAVALALAGEQVAHGLDLAGIFVATVNEPHGAPAAAWCATLATVPDPEAPIVLLGWAIAAAEGADEARRSALARAGCSTVDVTQEVTGSSEATFIGLAATRTALCAGSARRALLTAVDPGRCSCALVFERSEDPGGSHGYEGL